MGAPSDRVQACVPRSLFSARTRWPRITNRWSQAAAASRARPDLIDLTESNPTRVGLPSHADGIRRALAPPTILDYEPSPLGALGARKSVVDYYARRGLRTCAEGVLLVASTSEAYGHLFRLLADPGDEVLVPTPSYPLLQHLADLSDVRLVPYPLEYDGTWHLPAGSLEQRLTGRTRAIVLVSPNNPTGSILAPSERERVIQVAARAGLALISDEVFADYLHSKSCPKDASLVGEPRALCFSLSGLSKVAGLPQIKAGWMVLSGPASLVAEAEARLELVLDAHLSVSAPGQAVLEAVLPEVDQWQDILRARLAQNRDTLDRALADTPARRRAGQGGWAAIVELPNLRSDEDWALLLFEEHGILVQPGYLFDLTGRPCLVLSLILPPETFAQGALRLVQGVIAGSS